MADWAGEPPLGLMCLLATECRCVRRTFAAMEWSDVEICVRQSRGSQSRRNYLALCRLHIHFITHLHCDCGLNCRQRRCCRRKNVKKLFFVKAPQCFCCPKMWGLGRRKSRILLLVHMKWKCYGWWYRITFTLRPTFTPYSTYLLNGCNFYFINNCGQVGDTYTMSLSQSAQIFCPGGKPPVDGAAGRSTGALTCFVTGVGVCNVWSVAALLWVSVFICWLTLLNTIKIYCNRVFCVLNAVTYVFTCMHSVFMRFNERFGSGYFANKFNWKWCC